MSLLIIIFNIIRAITLLLLLCRVIFSGGMFTYGFKFTRLIVLLLLKMFFVFLSRWSLPYSCKKKPQRQRTNRHVTAVSSDRLEVSSMKLERSPNSSTPSPLGAAGGGAAAVSPTAGTSVKWSHRNSAFCPVRSGVAAADTPAAEMPFTGTTAAAGHHLHVPYGFINVPMSPYLWPLMLPYSPLAAAAGCVAAAGGTGVVGPPSYGGQQRREQAQLQQQQRQHFSPDRASLDAVGQTPEKARFTGEFFVPHIPVQVDREDIVIINRYSCQGRGSG